MTDAPNAAPAPKPGILDIAPYVGGKGAIAGFAEPMKLSSNENALGAGQKAREAYAAALKNIAKKPSSKPSTKPLPSPGNNPRYAVQSRLTPLKTAI